MSQAVIDFIKSKRPKLVDLEHHKIELTKEFWKVYPKLTELIQRAEVYSYWRSPKDKKRGKPWGHERGYFWMNSEAEIVGLVVGELTSDGMSDRLEAASANHRLLISEFGVIQDDCVYADDRGFGLPCINDVIFYAWDLAEDFLDQYEREVTPSAPAANDVVLFGTEANGDFWVYEKQSEIVYTVTAFGPCSIKGLVPIDKPSNIYKFPDDKTFVEFVEDFAEHNLKRLKRIE